MEGMDGMADALIVATKLLGEAPALLAIGTGQEDLAATSDDGIGRP
jgi:hypothetical protein